MKRSTRAGANEALTGRDLDRSAGPANPVRRPQELPRRREAGTATSIGDFMDFDCISHHNKENLRAVEGRRILADYDQANGILDRHQRIVRKTILEHDVQCFPKVLKGVDKTIVGQSLGCLCEYELSYMKGRPSNWQQAFAIFQFLTDGFFTYEVRRIFKHRFIGPDSAVYDGNVYEEPKKPKDAI